MDDKDLIIDQARQIAELRVELQKSKRMEDTYYSLYQIELKNNKKEVNAAKEEINENHK